MKILTGGCFNRIHEGHRRLLGECRKMGEVIVVLAHDSRNFKKNAVPAAQRKKNLEKEGLADKVVIGDKEDYMKVVRAEKPDAIVLGYDQKLPEGIEGITIIRMKEFEAKDKKTD